MQKKYGSIKMISSYFMVATQNDRNYEDVATIPEHMVEAIATEFEEEGFHFEDSNVVFEHESIRP